MSSRKRQRACADRGWRACFRGSEEETRARNLKRARSDKHPLIAVVGPCASGKSLLVQALRARGYNAREVLQEHSYVPAMWQRITRPDLLIYLDVSGDVARQRRSTDAPAGWWHTLAHRLRHARQHADLYLNTDSLAPQQVLEEAQAFLQDVAGLDC